MTNLVAQIRALKNNDPEAGEEARGWNSAIEAVLELLPVEPPADPDVRLTEMSIHAKEGAPFEASAQFQGDAVKDWSIAMVQWFREKGGINYVACDLSDPTTGERYEITMQKAGGRTPAQDLNELRSQLNRTGD